MAYSDSEGAIALDQFQQPFIQGLLGPICRVTLGAVVVVGSRKTHIRMIAAIIRV